MRQMLIGITLAILLVPLLPVARANMAGDESSLSDIFIDLSGGQSSNPDPFPSYRKGDVLVTFQTRNLNGGGSPSHLFNGQAEILAMRGAKEFPIVTISFPLPIKLSRVRVYPLGDASEPAKKTEFDFYMGALIALDSAVPGTRYYGGFHIAHGSVSSITSTSQYVELDFNPDIIGREFSFLWPRGTSYVSEIELYQDPSYTPYYAPAFYNSTNQTYLNETYLNQTFLNQTFLNETSILTEEYYLENHTYFTPTYLNQTFQNDTYLSAPNITYQNITQTSPNVTYASYTSFNTTNETYVTATEGVQSFYYENVTERIINETRPPTASGRDEIPPSAKETIQIIEAAPPDPFPPWALLLAALLVVVILLQILVLRKKPKPPPVAKTTKPIPEPTPTSRVHPPLPFKVVAPTLHEHEPPPPPSAPSEAVDSIKEHMDAIGTLEKTLKRADPTVKRLPIPRVETE